MKKYAGLENSGVSDNQYGKAIFVSTSVRLAFRGTNPEYAKVRNKNLNWVIGNMFSSANPIDYFKPKNAEEDIVGEIRETESAKFIGIIYPSHISVIAVKKTPKIPAPVEGVEPVISYNKISIKKEANQKFFENHFKNYIKDKYNIKDESQWNNLVKYLKNFDNNTNKVLQKLDNDSQIASLLETINQKEQYREMERSPEYTMTSGFYMEQGYPINNSYSSKNIAIATGPSFTLPVSQEEKDSAELVRLKFEEVLKRQNRLSEFLSIFFDQLEEIQDSRQLVKILPLIKRYEHKLKKIFNKYVEDLGLAISEYEKRFSDTKLDDIRDLIVENVRYMKEQLIELIQLFQDVENEDFIRDSSQIYNNILNIIDKVDGVVRDEWFGHIDYDILGKIRLGSIPLSVKGEN